VHPLGGIIPMILVCLLGAVLFLTIGFALAGWAETENQVPAIAQLITLPQFFFSGVFFSKDASPELIRPITNLLPLTFMNDALREISVQGATLWDVRMPILGLLVWTLIGFGLAVRFFRFDRF
jgi:ABC-2 type transport system permease protein